MKRTSLLIVALAVGFAIFTSIPASADHQIVSTANRRVGGLLVTEKTVQAGDDPAALFTVHRMRKAHGPSRGVLLLMPGGASNFAFYTADENGREIHSFAAYFATRGIEVWGYSPRTQGLAPGACSGGVDCSGMSEWGMQSVVDDALYIREQIRAIHGEEKPVIAGLSLGAMTTLAVLNASPSDWAGAVLWEGMIYSEDPVVLAANQVSCDAVEAQLAEGELWDDVNYPIIRLIYSLSLSNPRGPTPFPGFPPGFTNRQVFLALRASPQPAPPAYVPGYTLAVGSVAENRFFYSSEERLAMLINQLNHYEPLALVRDYTCALAGERTFSNNLPSVTAPVYAIGGGHGFGAWMGDNIDLLGSTDVTWNYIPRFGHGDHFASPQHRKLLERPLFDWLERVLGD